MLYGILKNSANLGSDDELLAVFAAPMKITSYAPELSGDTVSLRRIRNRNPSQRWEITAECVPGGASEELFVLGVCAAGSDTVFVRMPQIYSKRTMTSGTTVTVSAVANAGSSIVSVGLTNGQTLPVGEFIRFANHSKVYIVRTFSGGVAEIYPPLRTSVPAGTDVKHSGLVTMNAVFDEGGMFGITYDDGILSSPGTLKLVEDL